MAQQIQIKPYQSPLEPPGDRLKNLVVAAVDQLNALVSRYPNPAILWSGGKDSTVLLHLLRRVTKDFATVQYRDPWFSSRWIWMQSLADQWGLTVFDYPPTSVALYEQDGGLAAVSNYHIGNDRYVAMPRDIIEWTEEDEQAHEKWICGRYDFLARPTGTMSFPWGLVLIGHKEGDMDPLLGNVRLDTALIENDDEDGIPDAAFPLRDWTDKDIWDYIDTYNVPVQLSRYDPRARESKADKKANSDYLPMCINCVDCRQEPGAAVPCMKGGTMQNVGDLAPYVQSLEADYFTASNPKDHV